MYNLNEKRFRRLELSQPSRQHHQVSTPTLFKNNLASSGSKSMKTPGRRVGNGQKLIKGNTTNTKHHTASKQYWMKKAKRIRHDNLKLKLLLRKLRMIYL